MPSSWQLLLALSGLAFALPRSLAEPATRTTPSLLERHPELSFVRELDNSHAYIRFTVPSNGEVVADDEEDSSHTFELRVLPHPEACGSTNVTINDQSLSMEWDGASATGQTSLATGTSNERDNEQPSISWTISCLDTKPEPVQILTVVLKTESSYDTEHSPSPTGFTISFNQRSPRLIFISPSPDFDAHDAAKAPHWHGPPSQGTLPIAIFPVGDREDDVSSLELELQKLKLLSHVTGPYSDIVDGQRHVVDKLIMQRIHEAKANFHNCTSLRCMLKESFQLTRHAMDRVCARYDHLEFLKSFFSSDDCPNELTRLESLRPSHQGQLRIAMVQENSESCRNGPAISSATPTKSSWSSKILRPFLSSDELQHPGFKPDDSSTLSSTTIELTSPNFLEDKMQWAIDPRTMLALKISIAVTISVVLAGLFLCILRRCCSPRAKAERRARYEERRTRRQYRCLAKRHAWRTWWNNLWFFKDRRIIQYEEKRALIIAQEAVLEAEMQRRIDSLSYPQILSATMSVRVEEEPIIPATLEGPPLSRSSSLPSYRSRASSGRPPSYKEVDENSQISIADGFLSYTPADIAFTPEGTDLTPDSSVVGLSPRHSSESLRTYYYQV